jgi:hypothetical protein
MRRLALSAVLLSLAAALAATTAWSQETVSTASSADAHPPGTQATPGPLDESIGRETSHTSEVVDGPCGPTVSNSDDPNAAPDTHLHGEVSVGVGTGGYREVGGYVCKALPNGGSIAISGGQTQGNVGWGRR